MMKRLSLVIPALVLLCAATAAWAGPPATSAPEPASPAVAPAVGPAAAMTVDLLPSNPQPVERATFCPSEPITTCSTCFYFGQYLSYSCTTFCYNGQPRRTCGYCGSGCEP